MNYPTEPAQVHVRGARIDLSSVPDIELLEIGESRVRATFAGFGGVAFIPWQDDAGPLRDTTFGEPCHALEFADGSLRCVPLSYSPVPPELLYFTASSCTGPRVAPVSRECLAPPPGGYAIYEPYDPTCNPVAIAEVVASAGPITPTELYRIDTTTGACVPVPPDTFETFAALGNSVNPVDLFAEVRRVVRN